MFLRQNGALVPLVSMATPVYCHTVSDIHRLNSAVAMRMSGALSPHNARSAHCFLRSLRRRFVRVMSHHAAVAHLSRPARTAVKYGRREVPFVGQRSIKLLKDGQRGGDARSPSRRYHTVVCSVMILIMHGSKRLAVTTCFAAGFGNPIIVGTTIVMQPPLAPLAKALLVVLTRVACREKRTFHATAATFRGHEKT